MSIGVGERTIVSPISFDSGKFTPIVRLIVGSSLGATEHGTVDGVDNWACSYHCTAEVAAVQALYGVLARFDTAKFDID